MSVLRAATRQGRLFEGSAEKAMFRLAHHKLPTSPTRKVLEEALSIALAFHRPVYDCVDVALAVALSATLVTADERLVNSVSSSSGEVLGAL